MGIFSQKSFFQKSRRPSNISNMKFLVLALALIGAASAGYVAPLTTGYAGYGGYNTGYNTGFNTFAAPAVTAYNAPIVAATPVAPIVKNIVAAPSLASFAAPSVASYAAPFVKNIVAAPAVSTFGAAPAFSSYAAPAISSYAAPAFNSYAAPAISTYAAAPAFKSYAAPALNAYAAAPAFGAYGAQSVYGHGFGNEAYGLDLWKKKKAAAH